MSDAIENIRAILRDFNQSSWRDLFVRTDDWQLFLARSDGGPNPLNAYPCHPLADSTAIESASIAAQHLGIFLPAAQVGQKVGAGALVGTIRVLDRETPVTAETAGIVAWLAADGEFVEYGARLVEIA